MPSSKYMTIQIWFDLFWMWFIRNDHNNHKHIHLQRTEMSEGDTHRNSPGIDQIDYYYLWTYSRSPSQSPMHEYDVQWEYTNSWMSDRMNFMRNYDSRIDCVSTLHLASVCNNILTRTNAHTETKWMTIYWLLSSHAVFMIYNGKWENHWIAHTKRQR